jgi:hypothetical protein
MSVIIPRSTWKPRYANGFSIIGMASWLAAGKEIWLHHSVTNPPGPNATLEEDCAHMRDFESIGQNRFGGGISYTWVIMPSGRVFQGHDIDRQGSHTANRNDRSRAICLAGRYDTNMLPDRMANAAAALLRELGATIDGPHSQVYPTDCPGGNARARISYINTLAMSRDPIEGDTMSATDAYNGFAQLIKDMRDGNANDLAEGLRSVLTQYPMPKAPDFEIKPDGSNSTTIHDETRWMASNFRSVMDAVRKLQAGEPLQPIEGATSLSDEAAAKVARFVVAELKKEGN